MDRVPDNGAEWRHRLTPELTRRGLFVLDPTRKPISIGSEDMDQKPLRKELKAAGMFGEFAEIMKPVRWTDLRMVDLSDFLIISVDMAVHLCGSYEEMDLANRQKKPVLVWCQQGKQEAPDWMFAQIPHQHIFGSLEEILAYLDHYDSAPSVDNFKRFYDFNLPEFYNREVLQMIIDHLDEVEGYYHVE
jgi:hypothetical protein